MMTEVFLVLADKGHQVFCW